MQHRKLEQREFDALAKLLRSRDPSREAARLVLVEGLPRKVVAERLGMSGPTVSQAAGRFRNADALVRSAYLDKDKA